MENEEILALAKKRGLDVAEESLQALGQLAVDIIELYAMQNKYAKMLFVGLEDDLRKGLAETIDKLDGEKDVE